jgi:hypothetical protein
MQPQKVRTTFIQDFYSLKYSFITHLFLILRYCVGTVPSMVRQLKKASVISPRHRLTLYKLLHYPITLLYLRAAVALLGSIFEAFSTFEDNFFFIYLQQKAWYFLQIFSI